MSRRSQLALVALPLAVCPPAAVAQAPSPPGVHERELAQIIRQSGYDCREVERIEVRVSPDPAFDTPSSGSSDLQERKKVPGCEVGPGRRERKTDRTTASRGCLIGARSAQKSARPCAGLDHQAAKPAAINLRRRLC